jgi:two-component system OmpR family response regulator
MKSKVLLIDDDIELVGMFQEYLEQEGFDVKAVHDGEAGTAEAATGTYAIAIRDDTDRILGLELGADDYVTKPCTPRELTARIRAILRRAQSAPTDNGTPAALNVGQLTMWPEQRRAAWAGAKLELTSTEFNLLEVLARNAGRPVSKNTLSEQGLGRPLARFDRNIDVHLSSLRHKLGTIADGRSCLQTVYRLGYQLIKE